MDSQLPEILPFLGGHPVSPLLVKGKLADVYI